MVTKGERVGGLYQEFGINIYTLLYVKLINNKNLLYSTGNSTQYLVIPTMEKNLKKNVFVYNTHTHTHITESLCCTLETNMT